MVGKIFITRSGYDPQLGKHVKDPYLGPNPTLGACRPDIRRQLAEGDHIFVITGRVPSANQYVMGGFEIATKIHAIAAYKQFPQHRLQQRSDGHLTGNIIVGADGKQHELDDHDSFENRAENHIVGTNLIAITTEPEIAQGRDETLEALCDILRKRGRSPIEVVGRGGCKLSDRQVVDLRRWLMSLKRNNN